MLENIVESPQCSLYHLKRQPGSAIDAIIATTPETRLITNDPFIVGLQYTTFLRDACANILEKMIATNLIDLQEQNSVVLHILRGGLNFGLREAAGKAFGWNEHASAFISAQREKETGSETWHIIESGYNKVYLPKKTSIICGDVVATGTSLRFALDSIIKTAHAQQVELESILFFTIGGSQAEKTLSDIHQQAKSMFPSYKQSIVVYLEGCFEVATTSSSLSIKISGTDLIRTKSIMAPEFIDSQYNDPAYPLERCTIYDAGSRAFWLSEYYDDLKDYWEQTLRLAQNGMSFEQLLSERFSELDSTRFASPSLNDICLAQLAKLPNAQSG